MAVDGNVYCRINPGPGFYTTRVNNKTPEPSAQWEVEGKMAPFDREFYLTLGLGVGGFNDFPDNQSLYKNLAKPWLNSSLKAMLHFWRSVKPLTTWPGVNSKLQIDYVRIYAL